MGWWDSLKQSQSEAVEACSNALGSAYDSTVETASELAEGAGKLYDSAVDTVKELFNDKGA